MADDWTIASARHLLDRVDSWIRQADAKAAVVATFDAAVLIRVVELWNRSHSQCCPGSCCTIFCVMLVGSILGGLGCLVHSLSQVFLAIFPRTVSPNPGSPLYFGEIANQPTSSFVAEFSAMASDKYLTHLLLEVHTNSSEVLPIKLDHLRPWIRHGLRPH